MFRSAAWLAASFLLSAVTFSPAQDAADPLTGRQPARRAAPRTAGEPSKPATARESTPHESTFLDEDIPAADDAALGSLGTDTPDRSDMDLNAVGSSGAGKADKAVGGATDPTAAAKASAAPPEAWRFVWHLNHLWYYHPSRQWSYWDNDHWRTFRPGMTAAAALPRNDSAAPGYQSGYRGLDHAGAAAADIGRMRTAPGIPATGALPGRAAAAGGVNEYPLNDSLPGLDPSLSGTTPPTTNRTTSPGRAVVPPGSSPLIPGANTGGSGLGGAGTAAATPRGVGSTNSGTTGLGGLGKTGGAATAGSAAGGGAGAGTGANGGGNSGAGS